MISPDASAAPMPLGPMVEPEAPLPAFPPMVALARTINRWSAYFLSAQFALGLVLFFVYIGSVGNAAIGRSLFFTALGDLLLGLGLLVLSGLILITQRRAYWQSALWSFLVSVGAGGVAFCHMVSALAHSGVCP